MLDAYSLARVRLYKVPWTTILIKQEGSVRGKKSPDVPALMRKRPLLSTEWGGDMGVLGMGRAFSNIIDIGKTFLSEQPGVAFIILVQEIQ